jgi:hypothetical protein
MLFLHEIHPEIRFWLDVVADKAIKVIGVVVGAAWTYFLYRRSHPDQSKPEVEVEGVPFKKKGKTYLSIGCKMKNVGQSDYWIEKRGTLLSVFPLPGDEKEPLNPVLARRVFTDHTQMEAGATIRECTVLPIPDSLNLDRFRGLEIRLWVRLSGKVGIVRKRFRERLVKEVLLTDPTKVFGKNADGIFIRILGDLLLIYLEREFRKPLDGVVRGKFLEALSISRESSASIFMMVFKEVFDGDFLKVFRKYQNTPFDTIDDEVFAMIFMDFFLNDLRRNCNDLWNDCRERITEKSSPERFAAALLANPKEGRGKALEMIFTTVVDVVCDGKFNKELPGRLEEAAFGDLDRIVRKSFKEVFGKRLEKVSGSNFEKVFSENFERIFRLGFEKVKFLGSIRWKVFRKVYLWGCGEVAYTVYPTNHIINLPDTYAGEESSILGSFMREESNV